jgi:1,4-dihydroxy-2-naphthoate octaprenyltransferase
MSEARKIFCALAATLFALLVLLTVIQFGGHWAKVAALFAAFLAVISQFSAQDDQAKSFHLWVSWIGFAAALWAIIIFACGF